MSEEPKPQAPFSIKELSGRIGKYDIIKPLGKGAMGMVYLAHDTILERDVALKVMVAQIADDPELNERFRREAKAVAKMTHPNVVNVFDLGNHTDGSPYIAMELLKGQDLQKAMRQTPPMSLDHQVSVIIQVLAGLAHAHQAGIVHRDIKPANVFLNQDGTVKIMDFGVARLTTASMTGTGNIVGTADYMSPEQVKGAKVDGRSDLFSVGCMLFELLAGRRPFHAENLMAIFYKITHEEANFSLVPSGPGYDALMPILQKALAKNLEERYQTAYDFAVDLREYLKTQTTSASGQHALENLVDLEPPSSMPTPLTDAPGATIVPAEEAEFGSRPGSRSQAPLRTTRAGAGRTAVPGTSTRAGRAPTVVSPGTQSGATVRPGTTRLGPASAPTVVQGGRPAAPSRGSPVLYVVVGGMGMALLVAGGYIYLSHKPADRPVESPVAQLPSAAPPPTTQPPPPSTVPVTAPPPTLGEVKGKSAAAVRSAHAAFRDGKYDRAVAEAQAALREEPSSNEAQKILDNALNGQRAQAHFRTAEAALGENDFTRALAEADSGRGLAPWDGHGPDLVSRIQAQQRAQQQVQQQAQQQAQQQKQNQMTAQITSLLGQADAALAAQKYDAAVNLYDEVLKLDPLNARAGQGKTGAITARALAQAAGGQGVRGGIGRSFVSGRTSAQSNETRAGGSVPEGFEDSAGINVKKGTQAAELPGKITFEIDPPGVKAGEKYLVKVLMVNEGTAPIQIRDMLVTTVINGKKLAGPVPPLAKDIAPQQRALLLSSPDFWKEDTTSWSMEVVVHTSRGETYKNQVAWK